MIIGAGAGAAGASAAGLALAAGKEGALGGFCIDC
jgi:hypothetical protein